MPGHDASSPLRIALLGYRSNPYSGGQGIYIRHLARALTRLGHAVTVVSGPPYPQLDDDIPLVRLPSLDLFAAPNHITALRPRHLTSFTDFWEWASMATGGFPEPYTFGRRLGRWMRQHAHEFDIVHDNQSLCWELLRLQARGVPVVATIHHPIARDLEIALAATPRRVDRMLLRRWHGFLGMQNRVVAQLRHIVTVSEAARQDISECFACPPERIHVIHNGIDTDTFYPEPGSEPVPGRLMATASADAPLKGLTYLLQALARIRRSRPDVHLQVLGKLRPDGDTARQLAALGLTDAVTFRSGLDEHAVRGMYAQAQIAVVPSVYEGFGLPAGEAMACGVPVVSTTGGALPEVVGDAGVLVPVRDAEALANAITDLLDDAPRRAALAVAGKARIRSMFSWDRAAELLTSRYRAILA